MGHYKFTQIDWKTHLITIIPVLIFREMQDNVGTGLAMLFALGLGIFLELVAIKWFTTVAEFQDSNLILKKNYFSKAIKIPYIEIEKFTYSNATQFLKLTLLTPGNTIHLPPPARLAQAEELFAYLRTKSPAIEFEIIKPEPVLELS
ncbi:hypothetical protein AHMF7605_06950 [Adhaeribacter arboris]|uniref:PH domain-containing protein n=1 Tax=Adhaeribacter arboris TaxID=2072846 RepID=A0A2T2YCP9_9BACT|nr:hypothetical protein [Adhaeribacter arboris]PSR53287.1 hypothetical protein AHMF7605_06950 [Adhaeribacter arboris]